MSGFFKKPKWRRLALLVAVLAVCLITLHNKRRSESALVADSAPLAASIWALSALLPPGDDDAGNVSRRLEAELPDGRKVQADLEFSGDPIPWPGRLVLSIQSSAESAPQIWEIRPPFDQPTLEVLSGRSMSGTRALKEAEAVLTALSRRLTPGWPRFEPFQWRELGPGLETATVSLRYGLRLGRRELYLTRFDPRAYIFEPWHERDFGVTDESRGVNIVGWADLLPGARVLINGGQYLENRDYIGWLYRDGHELAGPRHSGWQGFFVSGPKPGAPAEAPLAAVLDTELNDQPVQPQDYENIMQSLMLFDGQGRIRVNNSFYLAPRSVIAQDEEGRIWLIMNRGGISLHDLAIVLMDPSLKLRRALCLDGGFEAQILWREPDGRLFSATSEYLVFPNETLYAPGMFRSLPSVIAARPRPRPSPPPTP